MSCKKEREITKKEKEKILAELERKKSNLIIQNFMKGRRKQN